MTSWLSNSKKRLHAGILNKLNASSSSGAAMPKISAVLLDEKEQIQARKSSNFQRHRVVSAKVSAEFLTKNTTYSNNSASFYWNIDKNIDLATSNNRRAPPNCSLRNTSRQPEENELYHHRHLVKNKKRRQKRISSSSYSARARVKNDEVPATNMMNRKRNNNVTTGMLQHDNSSFQQHRQRNRNLVIPRLQESPLLLQQPCQSSSASSCSYQQDQQQHLQTKISNKKIEGGNFVEQQVFPIIALGAPAPDRNLDSVNNCKSPKTSSWSHHYGQFHNAGTRRWNMMNLQGAPWKQDLLESKLSTCSSYYDTVNHLHRLHTKQGEQLRIRQLALLANTKPQSFLNQFSHMNGLVLQQQNLETVLELNQINGGNLRDYLYHDNSVSNSNSFISVTHRNPPEAIYMDALGLLEIYASQEQALANRNATLEEFSKRSGLRRLSEQVHYDDSTYTKPAPQDLQAAAMYSRNLSPCLQQHGSPVYSRNMEFGPGTEFDVFSLQIALQKDDRNSCGHADISRNSDTADYTDPIIQSHSEANNKRTCYSHDSEHASSLCHPRKRQKKSQVSARSHIEDSSSLTGSIDGLRTNSLLPPMFPFEVFPHRKEGDDIDAANVLLDLMKSE